MKTHKASYENFGEVKTYLSSRYSRPDSKLEVWESMSMLALLHKKCENELYYLLRLYVSDTACTLTSEASHVTFFLTWWRLLWIGVNFEAIIPVV